MSCFRPFVIFGIWGLILVGLVRADAPNVVLIISDDQKWTDYGFMGHAHVETPALDRLCRQSLTFTRGYVPSSLCRPSLATIATGLYPHQHGITGNDPALPRGANSRAARTNPSHPQHSLYESLIANIEKHQTLPRLMQANGYLTYQCGKWWEGDPERAGFTHHMSHGDPKRGGRTGDVGLKIGRHGLQPIYDFVSTARKERKPFFVWYAPYMPHLPHTPPKKLLDKYTPKAKYIQDAKYWAMCEWFDQTCGELLEYLDSNDLSKNTIVVYVCDNGWNNPVGPYRNIGVGGGGSRAKRSPFDGGTRTPIMIRWPNRVRPNVNKVNLASSIDLMPTVLTACGIDLPRGLSGINLLDTSAVAARDTIYGEIFEHDVFDLADPKKSLRYRWVIENQWKLIAPYQKRVKNEPAQLFDLLDDEAERRNLADAQVDRVNRLRSKLDAWWAVE